MGRKSSAKAQAPSVHAAPPPKDPPRSPLPAIAAAIVVVAVLGVLLYSRSGRTPEPGSSGPVAAQTAQALTNSDPPAAAKFGPHHQERLPPLPLNQAMPVRPLAEVNDAYVFAAEHPEVLGYVPCYCGCEHDGHRGNDDCFVRRRAANGDVIEWEPHGMT